MTTTNRKPFNRLLLTGAAGGSGKCFAKHCKHTPTSCAYQTSAHGSGCGRA